MALDGPAADFALSILAAVLIHAGIWLRSRGFRGFGGRFAGLRPHLPRAATASQRPGPSNRRLPGSGAV